jgi:hypothetical protein
MRRFLYFTIAAAIVFSAVSCRHKKHRSVLSPYPIEITSVEVSGTVTDRGGDQLTVEVPGETFQVTSGDSFVKEINMAGTASAQVEVKDDAMPPNTCVKVIEVQ